MKSFAELLDYIENNLSSFEKQEMEVYLNNNPEEKEVIDGIQLIYQEEGLSREELEKVVKEMGVQSFRKEAEQILPLRTESPKGIIHSIRPYLSIAANICILIVCLSFLYNNTFSNTNNSEQEFLSQQLSEQIALNQRMSDDFSQLTNRITKENRKVYETLLARIETNDDRNKELTTAIEKSSQQYKETIAATITDLEKNNQENLVTAIEEINQNNNAVFVAAIEDLSKRNQETFASTIADLKNSNQIDLLAAINHLGRVQNENQAVAYRHTATPAMYGGWAAPKTILGKSNYQLGSKLVLPNSILQMMRNYNDAPSLSSRFLPTSSDTSRLIIRLEHFPNQEIQW